MSKIVNLIKTILQTCEKRKDFWALSVKSRIAYANDLHTAEAVYHTLCDLAFRNRKSFPNDEEQLTINSNVNGRAT